MSPADSACDILLLDFRARVSGPRALLQELQGLFPREPAGSGAVYLPYTSTFELRLDTPRRGWHTIYRDGLSVWSTVQARDLVPSLEWAINNAAVEFLRKRYLLIHAGAVACGARGILLPAPAGSGKTTLVAALVAAGMSYLSDEVGVLDPVSGLMVPMPKSLCVKNGSRRLLAQAYPELANDARGHRFGGEPIWYVSPAARMTAQEPVPVRHIVLPRYVAGAPARLESIPRSAALKCLMEQSFSIRAHGAAGMRALVAALADADCYSLTTGRLEGVVDLLRAVVMPVPSAQLATAPFGRPVPVARAAVAASSAPAAGPELKPPGTLHQHDAKPALLRRSLVGPTRPDPAKPDGPSGTAPPRVGPAGVGVPGTAPQLRRRLTFRSNTGRRDVRTARRWCTAARLSTISSLLIILGLLFVIYGVTLEPNPMLANLLAVPQLPGLDRLSSVTPAEHSLSERRSLLVAGPQGPVSSTEGGTDDGSVLADQLHPGWAKHLRIPSVDLEADVVTAGIVRNDRGALEWPTLPFVAAHYVETSPVGRIGNAVISGHVVTMNEGNVFRNLSRVDYGDTVEIDTEDSSFTYVVDDIKLVVPTAVEVMDKTADARLTLITCGGDFDDRTRTFSRRLIVVAKLVAGTRSPGTPG